MRLKATLPVPDFSVTDLEGEVVNPATYAGRRLWLILTRFAACPFCALRLRTGMDRFDSITAAGVDVLVVFPSAERRVQQFARKYSPPFRLVADPDQKVFEAFGSETSWAGELRTAINVPKVFGALVKTRMNPLAVDDAIHRMPSEYLVEPDGTIGAVHYGESMDDGFAIEDVLAWADGTMPESEPPKAEPSPAGG
jgi:thioredoxin-dependent peroxiredoxin